MKKYKPLFENQEDIKEKSFNWVQYATSSSNAPMPSNDIIKFLQEYPNKVKTVYRGIATIRRRVSPENIEVLENLQVGNKLPDFMYKTNFKNHDTKIVSYTKRKSIASSYSKGGLEIVVQANPPTSNILLDLEIFAKILIKEGNNFFDKEDLDYMMKDKEVFLIEPFESEIISIKGNL